MPMHLWLVCGLPGAGKTTLAKRIVSMAHDSSRRGLRIERISFDDLFTQQQGALEFDPAAWKQCQQLMAHRVKAQLEQRNGDSDKDTVLLVDDNMQLRSMRKRFFHAALEAECGFGILYVCTPSEICRERNEARGESDRVPVAVFQRMVDAFEPPDGDKCAFEGNAVVFESDASLEDCVQRLLVIAKRLKQERREKVEKDTQMELMRKTDQELTNKNVAHSLDLALRQWISSALKGPSVSSADRRHEAERLNRHRKAFLADLKNKPSEFGCVQENDTETCISTDAIVAELMLKFRQNVQTDP